MINTKAQHMQTGLMQQAMLWGHRMGHQTPFLKGSVNSYARMWRENHLGDFQADMMRQRDGVPLRQAVHPGGADVAEVCRNVQVPIALGERRHAALALPWGELGRLHAVAAARLGAWRP